MTCNTHGDSTVHIVDDVDFNVLQAYHSGQWSALYSFCSTGGEVHDRDRLQVELEDALALAREHAPEDVDAIADALRMVSDLPTVARITWEYVGYGGTITFPDGRTVWLQGDEAIDLDNQLDACETEDAEQLVLSQYSEVAE